MEHRAKKQLETTGKAVRDWYPAFEKAHAMEPPDSPFYADIVNCVPLVRPYVLKSLGVERFKSFFAKQGAFGSFVDSLLTLAAWRPTQGIYRIEPTLYQALINTPVDGCIPIETLLCLPEWCVYIETPGLTICHPISGKEIPLYGVWVRLEGLQELDDALNIIFMVDFEQEATERAVLFPPQFTFPFCKDKPIGALIEELVKGGPEGWGGSQRRTGEADLRAHITTWVPQVLSLLLYLCTAPEYSQKGTPVPHPVKPLPKKIKGGMRLFPAKQPTTWEVGVRLGAALRVAYQRMDDREDADGSSHASPRGHIRRGHWHSYRTGPMLTPKGEPIPAKSRDLKTVWQPPIAVNLPDLDKMPAVIRQVKAPNPRQNDRDALL